MDSNPEVQCLAPLWRIKVKGSTWCRTKEIVGVGAWQTKANQRRKNKKIERRRCIIRHILEGALQNVRLKRTREETENRR